MREIRWLVFQLILLLVALLVLYLLIAFVPGFRAPGSLRPLEAAARPTIRPTAETAAIARAPQSFQYLVSFTERGFEPKTLNVTGGEVVRFVNNTDQPMRLIGADLLFSSSASIAPRGYAEMTFGKRGEYPYSDANTKRAVAVTVE